MLSTDIKIKLYHKIWLVTGKGFMQYGYLKNFSQTLVPMLNKDKQMKTFSKAHIV